MNQYTDIQVIECNRLHSEESKANNNENFALWQNNLQDILHFQAGDKISVHGAMISERGAGQSSSIEIKGESLGITHTFDTINLSFSIKSVNESKRNIYGADLITATVNSSTVEMFDNKGYFTINYFIPANGHNYIELPRRFWYSEYGSTDYNTDNYYTQDSQSIGMSLADPFGMTDTGPGATGVDRWDLYDDYYQISCVSNASLSKVKNDNSRYTILIREHTAFSNTAFFPVAPDQYVRDPENYNYFVYRELKEIVVPPGFNSPEFFASEITRQLQKVQDEAVWNYRDPDDLDIENQYTPGFPIAITKSISTETYKPFSVAGYVDTPGPKSGSPPRSVQEQQMRNLIIGVGGQGAFYQSQFHVVGCKRPEIFETGRLINRNPTDPYDQNNCRGSRVHSEVNGSKNHIDIAVPYDDYVHLFRDFIQAQEKYPEVWNIFSDSRTQYVAGDTIDNSRYCHINRFKNASMTFYNGSDADIINNTAMLGWGGYTYQTWNVSNTTCKSVILPFQYDSSQRDTFYDLPDETQNQRTYGCFGRNASGFIRIFMTENNGAGSALFTLIEDGGVIEESRKIGFDQHYSAPGMTYILPCDLRPSTDAIINASNHFQNDRNYNGNNASNIGPYGDETKIPAHQLYFGANSPKLNWNGTNFTFSDLHTPMNKGNNQLAVNIFAANAPYGYNRDLQGEGDVVYKINPREDFCDFTPVRKPYLGQVTLTNYSHASGDWATSYFNGNLEPWRVYDSLTGIMIENFGVPQYKWSRSFWGLLGFSYKQFHSNTNTRLSVVNYDNANDLSIITTNSEINEGDSKIYTRNAFGVPLFYNRLPFGGTILDKQNNAAVRFYPEIIQATQSMQIVADNLPTRMIRGYYTIRSNILQDAPFIGGKVNNTTMPIIGIVDKINGDGDFYFQQESSLVFTLTRPLSIASITCSVHDPDGSYARCSEQSTVLFKVEKNRNVTFNVLQEILEEQQGNKKQRL
jgi:hypothetical protein